MFAAEGLKLGLMTIVTLGDHKYLLLCGWILRMKGTSVCYLPFVSNLGLYMLCCHDLTKALNQEGNMCPSIAQMHMQLMPHCTCMIWV